MASYSLQLPLIQNWNCHSCGSCCKKHLIEVTPQDRQKILSQNWTAADGIGAGEPLVWFAGPPWRKRYRLAHRADGACVFLNEQGLCRIHAQFGEGAKPLGCQVYPYALHPAGKQLVVSLRFSCPSVVANRGKPVARQVDDLKRIADLTVPAGALDRIEPPALSKRERVDWDEFRRFAATLDELMADPQPGVIVRLLRALTWVRLVGQSKFHVVRGDRLAEFLKIITDAARREIGSLPNPPLRPSRAGRLQFRMLAAQYARLDTFEKSARGPRARVRLLKAALRFARGRGNIPALHPDLREIPFEQLEEPFGGIDAECDEILTRYLRVKIQGLHFCGLPYYGVPFVEGFFSLALVVPVVLWIARWLAAGESRDRLSANDVARAVTIADHQHGYSPALGLRSARRRIRLLTFHDDLERLCVWYAQ